MNLLDAAWRTVRNYKPRGAQDLAPLLNKAPTTLSHEVRPPAGSSAKLGLVDAADLVVLTDDWSIVNAFMEHVGGIAFRLPQLDEPDNETGHRMAQVAKEFAELMAEVATSAADGVITPNEMQRMNGAWSELMAEGQRMLAYFDSKQPGAADKSTRRKGS